MNEKKLLEFLKNSIAYKDAYVFYNTPKETLLEIKKYLLNLQSFNHRGIVLDVQDFINKQEQFQNIIRTVTFREQELIMDQLYEILIVTTILKQLLSIGIHPYKSRSDLEGIEQLLSASNYEEVCLKFKEIENISIWHDLEKLGRQYNPITIQCIIPNHVSTELQRNLNVLLDHHHYYQTTFLVEADDLSTYYEATGSLRMPIDDYLSYDLSNLNTKELVKLIKK